MLLFLFMFVWYISVVLEGDVGLRNGEGVLSLFSFDKLVFELKLSKGREVK